MTCLFTVIVILHYKLYCAQFLFRHDTAFFEKAIVGKTLYCVKVKIIIIYHVLLLFVEFKYANHQRHI